MNWSEIWILYRRELRSAVRERTIVVNSILLPVFLYPVLLWVLFSAQTFVAGMSEGFTSRIAFTSSVPEEHRALLDSLAAADGVAIQGLSGAAGGPGQPPVMAETTALGLLRSGALDALVSFEDPEPEGQALPGNFQVRIRYDAAEDRSSRARARVAGVVAEYRRDWVEREATALGLNEAEWAQFNIASRNVSSATDAGSVVLGQMISFFMVIMVALGCFVPSVDTTAGERERSTWETLATVAASRSSVVTAKYLYVATLGILAGMLNVTALAFSMGAVVRPLLESSGEQIVFSLPPMSIPVMLAGAGALALFFAAAMMILASFARSFKDGQAMVQPVYWLVLLPLLLGQQTDRTLTPAIASIPVANVSMMIRDALRGVFIWPLIAQTLAVTLLTVVVCLASARYILRFEDFLIGSFDGSFWRFVRDRMGSGKKESAT